MLLFISPCEVSSAVDWWFLELRELMLVLQTNIQKQMVWDNLPKLVAFDMSLGVGHHVCLFLMVPVTLLLRQHWYGLLKRIRAEKTTFSCTASRQSRPFYEQNLSKAIATSQGPRKQMFGNLVSGEVVSWWRVRWWRNSLVAMWPDTLQFPQARSTWK